MHQYVSLLIERFRMTVGELVMAYACVERVLLLHPTTMRASSIRPMLLGASIISCKTCRDDALSLRQVPPLSSPCSISRFPFRPDLPGARTQHSIPASALVPGSSATSCMLSSTGQG